MLKLDQLNRIYIPARIRKRCEVDFNKDVYFYVSTSNAFFLDNASSSHRFTTNLGKAYIDKNNKLYLPQNLRELLKIDKKSCLYFFSSESDVIYIKKRARINKNI